MRGNDHRWLTHQTTLPLGRETTKKERTRTEGDTKAPSASIASRACRKAGAQGKHTWNVVTTPGSVRGEKKRLEQEQVNRPKEWTHLQDSASIVRYRKCGGRATPQAERRTTRWEVPVPFQHPRSDYNPKGKGKRKNGSQTPEPPLQLATRLEGDEAEEHTEQGERPKGARLHRIRSRRHCPHPRSRSFHEKNKAGEGCDEQERQR